MVKLLSHAIQHNPRGGQVTLSLQDHGARVCLVVQDTGGGVSAAHQARLFQPFELVGAALSGSPGSGLGLALSYRIAA